MHGRKATNLIHVKAGSFRRPVLTGQGEGDRLLGPRRGQSSGRTMPNEDVSSAPAPPAAGSPVWPLVATIAMQTLATMAAFSFPVAAPEIARDLGVDGTLVGYFVSVVYGVGIVSAVLSPGPIGRFGAVRTGQFVMLTVIAMLLTAASGNLIAVGLSAVVLGIGYGATAPISAHLLVPRTPPGMLNLVLSIRQIGVPLGGVLGGLLVPPLVLAFGWRAALLAQLVPAVLLLVALQWPRAAWDADRVPGGRLLGARLLAPLRLLRTRPGIRGLSVACFVYAGIQLCFIAFMAVHLTTAAGIDLIRAGQALATFQVAGVVSRPIWGWLADRGVGAGRLLAAHGVVMAAAAGTAGQFAPGWPFWAVLGVCVVGGATAAGFTGIAYGEFARQGGAQRTEATAIGSAAMFAGVMVLPSAFGIAVVAFDGYAVAYGAAAAAALASALLLTVSRQRAPGGPV